MRRSISERELRNESGEIMRALDRGDEFTITRHGVPVGVLARRRDGVSSARTASARPSRVGRRSTSSPCEATWTNSSPGPSTSAGERLRRDDLPRETAISARRRPRRRAVDLLIASTALANALPPYTRNGADLVGLEPLIEIVPVPAA